MYRVRTPGYRKADPVQRWALPDRVFFACGACHVLAWAFLERFPETGAAPLWIRPVAPFTHNHIVVATSDWVFDYHGYCEPSRYFAHLMRRARRSWPGWRADLVPLPPEVLISETASRRFAGLHLREPGDFLHDALPRARAFMDRFDVPDVAATTLPSLRP